MKYENMDVETQEVSCSSTDADNKLAATLVLIALTKWRIRLSASSVSWE
jgi:hypothetical protein